MKTKNTLSLLFVTLSLALASCVNVPLKNQSVCTVAGIMAAGMNCANTISGDPYEMNLEETLKFLEPSLEENRAGAMCMSADDFNSMKTTIDLACQVLGSKCTLEVREQIKKVKKNLETLRESAMAKETKISSIPKKGDTSKDVKTVQEALIEKGFAPGRADGIFGLNTESAVKAFQKANALPGSGIIGPITIRLLGLTLVAVEPVSGKDTITQDLKGRKARHLHPTIRVMIENVVFAHGVPDYFVNRDVTKCVLEVSKALESFKIREYGGNNHGEMVGFIQSIIGPYVEMGTGDQWCMSAVQCVVAFLEDFFQVESPVTDSEHCVTTHNAAVKVPGLVAPNCETGSIWIARRGTSISGHTGMVMNDRGNASEWMETFEGNTGPDGGGQDGAYFRVRSKKKNGDLVTLSFVRVYPNNKV